MALDGFTIGSSAPTAAAPAQAAPSSGGSALQGFSIGTPASSAMPAAPKASLTVPAMPSSAPADPTAGMFPKSSSSPEIKSSIPLEEGLGRIRDGMTSGFGKAMTFVDNLTQRPAQGSRESQTTAGNFMSSLVDTVLPGVKAIRDNPELAGQVTPSDLAGAVPGAVGEVAQGLVHQAASYPLTFYGASSKLTHKYLGLDNAPGVNDSGEFSRSIPGIGDFNNVQSRIAEDYSNVPPPTGMWGGIEVAKYTGGELLNGLFTASLASSVVNPRTVAVSKPGVAGVQEGSVEAQSPKSFRSYEPQVYRQPVPTDALEKIVSENKIKMNSSFDPKVPTYFEYAGISGNQVIGRFVQVRPSFLSSLGSAFSGDVSSVPPEDLKAITGDIKNADTDPKESANDLNPTLMQETRQHLDEKGPDITSQALQDKVGATPGQANALVEIAQKQKVAEALSDPERLAQDGAKGILDAPLRKDIGEPGTYTAEEAKAEVATAGQQYDKVIESGDAKPEDIYKDPEAKVLQPDVAKQMVNDTAANLDKYQGGLGDRLRESVDESSATPASIQEKASEIIDHVSGGGNAPVAAPSALRGFTVSEAAAQPAAKEEKPNPQAGFVSPGKALGDITKGADARIKGFLKTTMEPAKLSEGLSEKIGGLEGHTQADLETANKLVKSLDISKFDDEALYHHAEDPSYPLTDKQRELEAKFDIPLKKANQALFESIKRDGVPMSDPGNYISRFPKEKPSVMQKVFSPVEGRPASAGQGGVLSKSGPGLKKRTMKILTDEQGGRTVASIKDGQVTAFRNRIAEPLGTLKVKRNEDLFRTETAPIQAKISKLQAEEKILSGSKGRAAASERRLATIRKAITGHVNEIARIESRYPEEDLNDRVFKGSDGKKYTVGEATTREIERHTDLEYYHSALASRILQHVKLAQIERANRFIDEWKASPEFAKIAVPSDRIAPEGWRPTKQVNFRNYSFEPRTAEILDDMQEKMASGNYNDAFQGINRVLANSIFFNGLAHPINVAVTWAYSRGASSLVIPSAYRSGMKAAARAWTALSTKNDDYMELLRNGAHLMSSDVTSRKLAENLTSKLSGDLEKKPDIHQRILKAMGFAGDQLNFQKNVIYRLSHDMAWLSNDFLTMQSIYEAMDRGGMTMPEAIKEVSRFIPDYRQQPRILDNPLSAVGAAMGNQAAGEATARGLARFVYNRNVSMFGAYHVGLMQSLFNAVKDASYGKEGGFGADDMAARKSGLDKLAMLAILGLVVYPFLDRAAQSVTQDPNTYVTRSGVLKYPYLAYKWATGQANTTQLLTGIVTPAVGTLAGLQLAFNRDLFTGNQIYGPGGEGAGGFISQQVAPLAQASKIASGAITPGSFGATLLGVHTPKNTQLAQDLNAMIYTQKLGVLKDVKAHLGAGDQEGAYQSAKAFNDSLAAKIREADIAAGNSGSDARVSFFLNKYGAKIPGAKAMQSYAQKQGKGIIEKTLPSGKPVIVKDTPLPATGVIGTIETYAKAIGTNPIAAFQDIFSGQRIKEVTNGTIIVQRMALSQSQAAKSELGGGSIPRGMTLDHIVSLENGGTNSADNLQLVSAPLAAQDDKIENFLGDGIKSGAITGDQAREIEIRFKAGNGETLTPAIMDEYNSKYGGKPLSLQDLQDQYGYSPSKYAKASYGG